MNYISTLKLLNEINKVQDIKINLEELDFKDEDNQIQSLYNEDIELDAIFEIEDDNTYCKLLFIDNKNKIAELVGEDFELQNIELSLTNSLNEDLPFCITNLMEETTQDSLRQDKLQDFVYGLNKEESLYITGQKPDALFGYDLGVRDYQVLAREIYDYLEKKILYENISYFVTGGKLGIETIAFFSIQKLKEKYPNIYNIMAVPYLNMDGKWPKDGRDRYRRMLNLSDKVIEIDTIDDYKTTSNDGKILPEKVFHPNKLFQQHLFTEKNTNYTISVYKSPKTGEMYFNDERKSEFF